MVKPIRISLGFSTSHNALFFQCDLELPNFRIAWQQDANDIERIDDSMICPITTVGQLMLTCFPRA